MFNIDNRHGAWARNRASRPGGAGRCPPSPSRGKITKGAPETVCNQIAIFRLRGWGQRCRPQKKGLSVVVAPARGDPPGGPRGPGGAPPAPPRIVGNSCGFQRTAAGFKRGRQRDRRLVIVQAGETTTNKPQNGRTLLLDPAT